VNGLTPDTRSVVLLQGDFVVQVYHMPKGKAQGMRIACFASATDFAQPMDAENDTSFAIILSKRDLADMAGNQLYTDGMAGRCSTEGYEVEVLVPGGITDGL
jgi:hypothetical protein